MTENPKRFVVETCKWVTSNNIVPVWCTVATLSTREEAAIMAGLLLKDSMHVAIQIRETTIG